MKFKINKEIEKPVKSDFKGKLNRVFNIIAVIYLVVIHFFAFLYLVNLRLEVKLVDTTPLINAVVK